MKIKVILSIISIFIILSLIFYSEGFVPNYTAIATYIIGFAIGWSIGKYSSK